MDGPVACRRRTDVSRHSALVAPHPLGWPHLPGGAAARWHPPPSLDRWSGVTGRCPAGKTGERLPPQSTCLRAPRAALPPGSSCEDPGGERAGGGFLVTAREPWL